MEDGRQTKDASRPAPENIPFPSEFNPQQPRKARTQEQMDADAALDATFSRALEEL